MTTTETRTATGIPEWWWDEFEPPPGYSAEIVGGELFLSPMPILDHGRVQLELAAMLEPQVPEDCRVHLAEWRRVDEGMVTSAKAPDLMVAPRQPRGAKALFAPPLLTIEVLSDSDHDVRHGLTYIEAKRRDFTTYGVTDHIEISFARDGSLQWYRYELDRPVGDQLVLQTVGPCPGQPGLPVHVTGAARPFPYEIDLGELTARL